MPKMTKNHHYVRQNLSSFPCKTPSALEPLSSSLAVHVQIGNRHHCGSTPGEAAGKWLEKLLSAKKVKGTIKQHISSYFKVHPEMFFIFLSRFVSLSKGASLRRQKSWQPHGFLPSRSRRCPESQTGDTQSMEYTEY